MQIVIDIPEKCYNDIHNSKTASNYSVLSVLDGIRNGTILPKGHGDLIDRNELKKVYNERITYLYALNRKDNPSREAKICATNWCSNSIDELPTIIEADKAESEDKK